MAQFTITITRVGYASKDIEVEAETYEKAVDMAHEEASSLDFSSEHTADYYDDNELPQHVPAGHQVVSAEALGISSEILDYLRSSESTSFAECCDGWLVYSHIFYKTLMLELLLNGSVEWEGEVLTSIPGLDKHLAFLYAEHSYEEILEQEKEDAEVQDEKDHKNGLYGEEY